ncbi:MAG TPA: helicase-associated domain-containing protein, partial [Ktedonobacteraceae bacterium]|nr:helicase-associated domain-containing protein [Ktedonobacteraceae bacterium]
SVGQEYCRIGAVHSTKRQGMRVSGIVDVQELSSEQAALHTNGATHTKEAGPQNAPGRYNIEVEIRDGGSWIAICTCNSHTSLCVHAAALLYQWVAHPLTFTAATSSPDTPLMTLAHNPNLDSHSTGLDPRRGRLIAPTADLSAPTSSPSDSLAEMFAQSSLSELRTIAREYDITTVGLGKPQLVDAIAGMLAQPEVVRRAARTLEKPQRQLLAALTLAGGAMNDEDLRGLCERFSLGNPGQLQTMLLALQNKAFIVRTSLNNSLQQRIGLSGPLLEVHWRVPLEVRTALHVTLPITSFDIESHLKGDDTALNVHLAEPYNLLADLLLVARALDGHPVEREAKRAENGRAGSMTRSLHTTATDGSMLIPPPNGISPSSLLESLQVAMAQNHSSAFLRFAVRLLRMAEILYPDDAPLPCLRVLPNAARLLLGPGRAEVVRELFTHWLQQASYAELFELNEEGVRLYCRTTPLNQPALRAGELELENREARQALIALFAQAPLDRWINFPAFVRFVYRLHPFFLQRRQRQFSSPHWWIEQEEGRPLRPAQLSDWMRAEGRYLARLLEGPLHWLGIADIVLSPDERLLAFRLTPVAGSLLSAVSESSITGTTLNHPSGADVPLAHSLAEATITVTGGDNLLLPSVPANWEVIELLEQFAEIHGVQAGQLCYRLTATSLCEALGRGQSPAPLLQVLREAAKPTTSEGMFRDTKPIEQLLAELERKIANYGRVRLYSDATLLEVADGSVLRELSALTSIDQQIVRSIHPTLMIVKKQGGERLVEELKRRGQVPLLHDEVE